MQFIWPVLLFATPMLIAAAGELVVERAGIVNIGIEGMMLAGALAGWLVNAYFGPAAGIGAAILAAMLLALLFAAVILLFAADQIVTGTGINLLALGVTGLIYERTQESIGRLTIHQSAPALMVAFLPLLLMAVWLFLRFTRGGLELIAIGESPQAADTAGVPVNRRKLYAILFGGACAGLAGAYLSTFRVALFTENMTEGQGFLAIAIVIFGRWSPPGILIAGLFFGLVRAYADHLNVSAAVRPEFGKLFNMLPYAVSILALAGATGRARPPAALGVAYVRE